MTKPAAKPENEIRGCDTVARLFAVAFRLASSGLNAGQVAKLLQTPVGDLAALGWVDSETIAKLTALVDTFAAREGRDTFRVREEQRAALLELLGPEAARSAPKMFVLAWALDHGFAELDGRVDPGGAVATVPVRFLDGIDNPPPPIGQMTPIAACRRWMRGFWFLGDSRNLEAFGTPLRLQSRRLSERARQSLQRANDENELVLSLVSWRRHRDVDLRMLAAREGCFAVAGAGQPATDEEVVKVLAVLREHGTHVAIFPELAMTHEELELLKTVLARRRGRFPALTVLGLAHVRRGETHVNEARVLDAVGEELLSHHKIEAFTDRTGRLEDIVPRSHDGYEFLDTPVGRLVVNVCRDFRSDIPMFINRILAPTLVAVPAYSDRLDFVVEEARLLGARQGAIVAAVNPASSLVRDAAVFSAPIRGRPRPPVASPAWDAPEQFCVIHTFRLSRGATGLEAARPPVTV